MVLWCFSKKDGRAGGRTNGRTDGRADGRADGRTDGRADGRTGGRTDGRTDGRILRHPFNPAWIYGGVPFCWSLLPLLFWDDCLLVHTFQKNLHNSVRPSVRPLARPSGRPSVRPPARISMDKFAWGLGDLGAWTPRSTLESVDSYED